MDSITITFDEWTHIKELADRRMKTSNGHSFVTILKTRCQYCGRSRHQQGRCRAWFQTFLFHVDTILLNIDQERKEWAPK